MDRVQEAAERRNNGERRKFGELRPYFCRSCNREELATMVPDGWYTLARHTGSNQVPRPMPIKIGAFCSADCLGRYVPHIERTERNVSTQTSILGRESTGAVAGTHE